MHETAMDAKRKWEETQKRYFEQLKKMASEQRRRWSVENQDDK